MNEVLSLMIVSMMSGAGTTPPAPTSAPAPVKDRTTREERAARNLTLLGGVEGDILGGKLGVAGYYHLHPSVLLGVELRTGWRYVFLFGETSAEARVGSRFHLGNSFYGSLGLAYRTRTITGFLLSLFNDRDEDVTFSENADQGKGSDLAVDVGIGNEWRFGAFVLGVEWFGLSTRLAELSYRGPTASTAETDAEVKADFLEWTQRDWRLPTLWVGGSF
jgi:hypothetical protein